MKNKKIIAIVGMAGSGKSEVVKYLQKKFNWPKVYFGEPTFERIKADGLELTYSNEQVTREKIRKELGMDAYAKLALPKIKILLKTNNIVLVESLYSWQEYKLMKKEYKDNFKVLAVFASPDTRFKRLVNRKKDIGKQRTRIMHTIKEFNKRDYTEIENIAKGGPIARADFMIVNEGNLKTFHKNIDNAIKQLI